MHCASPRDCHRLGLTRIQFHPPQVTPLINPAKVTDQGLCYCNSDAWGWHNSHYSGVISITSRLFSKMEKSSEVHRINNTWPKTLPCGTPDTTLTSLIIFISNRNKNDYTLIIFLGMGTTKKNDSSNTKFNIHYAPVLCPHATKYLIPT